MSMQAHGTARKFGDHVDTDVIIPARYLNAPDEKSLASHCMEDLDSDFKKKNGYAHSIELSREYHLYRQDYCGCIYSRLEREEQKKNKRI